MLEVLVYGVYENYLPERDFELLSQSYCAVRIVQQFQSLLAVSC